MIGVWYSAEKIFFKKLLLLGLCFTAITGYQRKYTEITVYFTIMVDEGAFITNEKQLVICIRWVDGNLEVHEVSVGHHPLIEAKVDTIVKVILDTK